MTKDSKHFYEFGPFRLDAAEQQLWRDGEEIALTPKAFGVLLTLIRNSGHAVSKEEFMREVWPDTIVEEKNLTDNISILRQLLGDSPQEQRFIKTVPRRGYRFVTDVREVTDGNHDLVVHETSQSRIVIQEEIEPNDVIDSAPVPRRWNPWVVFVAGALGLGVIIIGFYLLKRTTETKAAHSTAMVKSIAVLPFKSLVTGNSDPALELGMTDALITRLSNIREVVVRPTSAVLKYHTVTQDALAAGREQGVDALLDGKVQKSGDRVRVTVQLIRVSDGVPLWGHEFDESLTNIFLVQDSISQQAVRALTLRLTSDEQKRITSRYTENVEAYQLYLQGRHFMEKRTIEDLRRSLSYFQQAIDLDAKFAPAYSGIAYSYHLLVFYNGLTPEEGYPLAKQNALKALEIDPALAEAYASLARIKEAYDNDAAAAGENYRRAIELNPNYASAHRQYSRYLLKIGRVGEAVAEARRAQEIDPLSLIANAILAEMSYYDRQYDQTLKYMRRVREIDAAFQTRYIGNYLYLTYMQKGMYEEAIIENARRLSDRAPEKEAETVAAFKGSYRASGVKGIWQKQIDVAQRNQQGDPDLVFFMAEAHTHLGEKDQAFIWLNRALDQKHPAMPPIRYDPDYETLHSDPRFEALLRRVAGTHY